MNPITPDLKASSRSPPLASVPIPVPIAAPAGPPIAIPTRPPKLLSKLIAFHPTLITADNSRSSLKVLVMIYSP